MSAPRGLAGVAWRRRGRDEHGLLRSIGRFLVATGAERALRLPEGPAAGAAALEAWHRRHPLRDAGQLAALVRDGGEGVTRLGSVLLARHRYPASLTAELEPLCRQIMADPALSTLADPRGMTWAEQMAGHSDLWPAFEALSAASALAPMHDGRALLWQLISVLSTHPQAGEAMGLRAPVLGLDVGGRRLGWVLLEQGRQPYSWHFARLEGWPAGRLLLDTIAEPNLATARDGEGRRESERMLEGLAETRRWLRLGLSQTTEHWRVPRWEIETRCREWAVRAVTEPDPEPAWGALIEAVERGAATTLGDSPRRWLLALAPRLPDDRREALVRGALLRLGGSAEREVRETVLRLVATIPRSRREGRGRG